MGEDCCSYSGTDDDLLVQAEFLGIDDDLLLRGKST